MADDPGSPHTAKEPESSKEGSHESTRLSEYAENRPNPLPELAVDPQAASEPVSNLEELKAHDDANPFAGVPVTRPPGLVQPDGGDQRGPAVVFNDPERSWIGKHKSWVIAGLLLAVITLVATVVGVVVKGHKSVNGGGST
ncbi:hypothetical protein N0V93_008967 [Gnomoniopsis smithogilvyi]|uniref:Uncharacterized protein n=1 Tax=Gnomoniopsis smithogilvyi TaxID=1191159 RepID=A0A9W8YLV7_9PEZI|nr:hypothetical protein N0V93_008967 [Gnomoniopsis smithogilvyi]